MKRCYLILYVLCLYGHAFAQLPEDTAFNRAIAKQTRTLTGEPGEKYWQNRADYDLHVDFDPTSRLLKGQVEIEYVNNSPDTLKSLWFKLYPNLYKKGVKGKAKIAKSDQGEGLSITQFILDDKRLNQADWHMDGTNMYVDIPGLAAGKKIKIAIQYHYTLNAGSHMRTGQVDTGAFFIAYFFPRIAVYDDIDGWNRYPYTGEEEFYNDFCNFKAEITVPKSYVVWATGDLKNAKKVFHPTVLKKIEEIETSQDRIVDLIDKNDLQQDEVTKRKGKLTYQFDAENVVDFAFATSDHYVWRASSIVVDSASGRKTRVESVYNPDHQDYEEVIDFAITTVKGMSYVFPAWPYPYPHITVFDGLDQMEYPMMANDNPTKNREDGITLTSHEIFHTMFPFYMGINETKFGWMDEGWATIGEWKLSKLIDSTYIDDYGMDATSKSSGEANDTPIMTLTPDLKGVGAFTDSYPKPALGYLFAEEYLGKERFKRALHHYIHTWQGKHPQPLDFFHSINTGAGENLDWFWEKWFYGTGSLDLGITQVEKTETGYVIEVQNKGDKPLPVHLTLYYADGGSPEELRYSIAVWQSGNMTFKVPVKTAKSLVKVVLGDTYVPDKYPADNQYNLPPKG